MEVISTTAKVIILRLNATPKTEGIYEFQGRDKDSILNPPKYSASDFQKLGRIIGVTEYLIKFSSIK